MQTINSTEITWIAGNKTQLNVVFDSGVAAEIIVFPTQLLIQITSSEDYLNKTIGLLGLNNNDKTDDLTRPDGTFIPINSTQETIYHQFGLLCKYL